MLSDLAPRAWPAPPSGVGQRLPLMCLRSPSPIAHVLTAIARAPDVVDRRFVTYAREAKSEMLGIPSDLILAAAPLGSLSVWHDSAPQRGQPPLSNRQVPGHHTAAHIAVKSAHSRLIRARL